MARSDLSVVRLQWLAEPSEWSPLLQVRWDVHADADATEAELRQLVSLSQVVLEARSMQHAEERAAAGEAHGRDSQADAALIKDLKLAAGELAEERKARQDLDERARALDAELKRVRDDAERGAAEQERRFDERLAAALRRCNRSSFFFFCTQFDTILTLSKLEAAQLG